MSKTKRNKRLGLWLSAAVVAFYAVGLGVIPSTTPTFQVTFSCMHKMCIKHKFCVYTWVPSLRYQGNIVYVNILKNKKKWNIKTLLTSGISAKGSSACRALTKLKPPGKLSWPWSYIISLWQNRFLSYVDQKPWTPQWVLSKTTDVNYQLIQLSCSGEKII
jgi:hypothetical protein